MIDFSSEQVDYVINALARGPATVGELVQRTGLRLRVVLLILRDMQRTDGARRLTSGRYRLMEGSR